ncbi:MAG: integrase/recombinase XerD [Acidimicrobiaceae bacterium]|nr:integrase/recombinase XerD [Acidimicrobiaceae bacterium]
MLCGPRAGPVRITPGHGRARTTGAWSASSAEPRPESAVGRLGPSGSRYRPVGRPWCRCMVVPWISHHRRGAVAAAPGVPARPGGAHDHHRHIHRHRRRRPDVQRSRTLRPGRLPGRLPGPHPRRLRPRPAPVHRRADIECFGRDLEAAGRSRAPWPGGCAPWPASTATPSRKNCSTTPRRSMSADPAWTTSPTPPDWTATRSAPCWSRPDSARGRACPHLVAGPQRVAGVRGHRCQHRGHGPGARPSDPDHLAQGRQDGHHPVGATHRPGRRPGRRGTLRRADLPGRRRQPPRPPRRRQDRAPGGPAGWDHQTSRPHTLRHAFITAALDAGVPLRDVQEAASHADPRTTMRYDRARVSLDRHATYIVAAFIAGAAR